MSISATIKKLQHLGDLPEQPYSYENRRILLLNKIAIVATLITTIIVSVHVLIGNTIQPLVVSLGLLVSVPAVWFQSVKKYKLARIWFLTGFYLLISFIFFHSVLLDLDTATEHVLVLLIPLTLIFLDGKASALSTLFVVLSGAGFIAYRYATSGVVNPKEFYGLEINWVAMSVTVYFCMIFFKKSLVRANELIIRDREKLAVADKTKNFLFAVISHDIRSPLNILSQYLQLDPAYRNDPKQFEKFQVGLTKKVEDISQTLDDLLFWAKTQLQGINTNPSLFAVGEVAIKVTSVIEDLLKQKTIELILDLPEDHRVYCDKDHLTVALRNLVQNAIKFSVRGGKLTIASQREGDQLKITVMDTGKGMDGQTLQNLREGVMPKSHMGTAGEVGTGLGLSLVKELIAKNEGHLEIESEKGKGTRMVVILPATG